MNIDDLIEFCDAKNDAELSRKLGVTRGSVSRWRKDGINIEKQALYEIASGGEVRADRNKIESIFKK